MVSPVFKYTMALIVGAIFFGFLIKFAFTYVGQTETIDAYKLMNGFDDILSAVGVSGDAFNNYEFGIKTKMKVTSEEIMSGGQRKKHSKVLFSPYELEGSSLKIMTKRWKFPFDVCNFFYLTNPNYKYYLIYDDDNEYFVKTIADPDDITSEINDKMGVDIIHIDNVDVEMLKNTLQNFQGVTFVFFVKNDKLVDELNEVNNFKARRVEPSDEDEEYGIIYFEDGTSLSYLTLPMLIGGIFVEDSFSYERSVELAFDKFKNMALIYLKKIELSNRCDASYSALKSNLNNYVNELRGEFDISSSKFDKLQEMVENLKDTNAQLGGGECPEIF